MHVLSQEAKTLYAVSLNMIAGLLLYLVIAIFVAGILARIWRYARTPAPLKIPLMPAPQTRGGVLLRLAAELVLFRSLFRASRWTWVFGWLFHAGLLVVVLSHFQYFSDPIWWWVAMLVPYSHFAAYAMVFGLIGLLCRRILIVRIRYISAPSDYLMLLLLLTLASSGLLMHHVFYPDILAVRRFTLGMITGDLSSLPVQWLLWVHISLFALLMLIFPFSKLLHAPGIFFNPVFNQRDNAREQRHINPWSKTDSTAKNRERD